MSTKYKARDNNKAYFITITTVEWVDLFTRLNHKYTIVNALKYCQENKGLEIYAYVLMPSHLHMLCRVKEGFNFSDMIRDFKKHTSKALIQNIKEQVESRREWLLGFFSKACEHLKREQSYKVWQDGYHAEEISSNKFIYQKLNYIHNNPVKDKIVEKPEDYLFSSARNYAELESFLQIELLPPQLITYSDFFLKY
jgi:REP element-mobilizing transposase RayT